MGKGSKPRRMDISKSEFDLRWELIELGTNEERKLEILKQLEKIKKEKEEKKWIKKIF